MNFQDCLGGRVPFHLKFQGHLQFRHPLDILPKLRLFKKELSQYPSLILIFLNNIYLI